VEAAQQAGHPFNEDYNSGDSTGVSYVQTTIRNGRRATSWVEYVRPVADHPNLTVKTEATVSRLLVDGEQVTGVEYLQNGVLKTVRADEVVLSAGVFGTPQILMLSGVGPADRLRRLGLTVRADLPGVGQNLQDHFSSPVIWESDGPIPGPTVQGLEAQVFARTGPGMLVPDVQPIFMSFVYGFISGPLPEHGFSTVSQILHPHSRGEVTLRSTNPTDAPLIDPRVLSEPHDLEVLVDNMFMIREIGAQSALQKFIKAEARPGPDVRTREEMREYVRSTTVSGHHQVGTARIGVDSQAVVDPQLRVHGLRGLRVADASVMPTLPTGNTNAPSLMIGERAADLILGKGEK
jgi:choline dehydrogenase